MAPTEAQERLKDQFVHAHGYWNPLWDPILQGIPCYPSLLVLSVTGHRTPSRFSALFRPGRHRSAP